MILWQHGHDVAYAVNIARSLASYDADWIWFGYPSAEGMTDLPFREILHKVDKHKSIIFFVVSDGNKGQDVQLLESIDAMGYRVIACFVNVRSLNALLESLETPESAEQILFIER